MLHWEAMRQMLYADKWDTLDQSLELLPPEVLQNTPLTTASKYTAVEIGHGQNNRTE